MVRRVLLVVIVLLLPASVAAWYLVRDLFRPPAIYATGEHPLDVVVGDIDQDGNIDVLTANREGFSVSVFLGNGDGTLSKLEDIPFDFGATSLALGDMDRDGTVDLIVTLCNVGCTENHIAILSGDGHGSFTESILMRVEGVPYNIAVADLDMDERLDIAATDYPGNRILVFLSYGNESPGEYTPVRLATGESPIALLVQDVNKDGLPDLISSNHRGATATVYLSLEDGDFEEPITVDTGRLPYSIALGKANKDEFPDLFVAHSTAPGKLSIHRGRGDGRFRLFQEIDVDDRLVFVTGSEFNGDGLADILVTRNKEAYASLFLSRSYGNHDDVPVIVPAQNRVYSLAVSNLNDDEYSDLITVDYEANTLSVSLGRNPNEYEEYSAGP